MFVIQDGQVYLNDRLVTWPVIEVAGNETPLPSGTLWPYQGFHLATESGWSVHIGWNKNRKYREEGTPEEPQYSIGPCDICDAFNDLTIRKMIKDSNLRKLWIYGIISADAVPALLANVATWPSPPAHLMSVIRQARLDGRIKVR
jgi:hypothetical protein